MAEFKVNIQDLFRKSFGQKPYVTTPDGVVDVNDFKVNNAFTQKSLTPRGSTIYDKHKQNDVFLPIYFRGLDYDEFGTDSVLLPYASLSIQSKKTIIKTPLVERGGTVKEQYSIDDYSISIKGIVIDLDTLVFPEAELLLLKKLYETQKPIFLDNAVSNIFLKEDRRVIIEDLDIPETPSEKHYFSFTMKLESDVVFKLDVA